MNLGFPAHERPIRNALIAVSHCAKIMPSRAERVSRFSVRLAVSYIERSTRSLCMGNVESEKGPSPIVFDNFIDRNVCSGWPPCSGSV